MRRLLRRRPRAERPHAAVRDRPGARAARTLQPGGAPPAPRTSAAVLAMFASVQSRRGDARRSATCPRTGARCAGSMMWCIVAALVAPAPHRGARGRKAAAGDRDRLPGGAERRCGGRRSRGSASPLSGPRPAVAMSPPEADEHTAVGDLRQPPRRRDRRPTLWRSRRGRARSRRDADSARGRRRARSVCERRYARVRRVQHRSASRRRASAAPARRRRSGVLSEEQPPSRGRSRRAQAPGQGSDRRRHRSARPRAGPPEAPRPAAGRLARRPALAAFTRERSESSRKRLHARSIASSSPRRRAARARGAPGSVTLQHDAVPSASHLAVASHSPGTVRVWQRSGSPETTGLGFRLGRVGFLRGGRFGIPASGVASAGVDCVSDEGSSRASLLRGCGCPATCGFLRRFGFSLRRRLRRRSGVACCSGVVAGLRGRGACAGAVSELARGAASHVVCAAAGR